MTRRLMEGSEAIAEAMVAAGCRFFSGYPMTPFTEVLEHMARKLPPVGGVCMNAESELEAVGMAWGAAATGTRAATGSTGQGLSLMQESLAEICLARLPLVVLNMARAQGDYWQATREEATGTTVTWYWLPWTSPKRSSWSRWHSSWPRPGATRCWSWATTTWLTPAGRWSSPDSTSATMPVPEWALEGRSGGSGRAKLYHRWATPNSATEWAMTSPLTTGTASSATAGHAGRSEPLVETGHLEDAELIVVAFGTPARYVRAAVGDCAEDGMAVGFVRPITLVPFPAQAVAAAAGGARAVAVYENNQGQMVDDVRLAVLGRTPGALHRRPELSTARGSASPPTSTWPSSAPGSSGPHVARGSGMTIRPDGRRSSPPIARPTPAPGW